MKQNEKKYNDIKATQKILMCLLSSFVALAAIVVVLYEFEILLPGNLAADGSMQYVVLMLMELLTICTIPLALKMFSFRKVKMLLVKNGNSSLRLFGTIRIAMLGLPLLINTILYYQFMAVAFAYMAIIGLLCVVFVYPSMDRCMDEIHCEK